MSVWQWKEHIIDEYPRLLRPDVARQHVKRVRIEALRMAVSRMAVNDVSIWCAKRWPASAETIEIDSACSVGKRERQLDFIDAGGPNGEKLRGKNITPVSRH